MFNMPISPILVNEIISPTSKSSELFCVGISQCKSSLHPTFSPILRKFRHFGHEGPVLLATNGQTSAGKQRGASECQRLGVENPDGKKTKTCLGIHPFFGVRANKMSIRSPECFLIWVWKNCWPQGSARFYDDWSISDLSNGVCLKLLFSEIIFMDFSPVSCISNFASKNPAGLSCLRNQPRLRTMSFCVKVPTGNRMHPGFSLAIPNHQPSFYSRIFNRII